MWFKVGHVIQQSTATDFTHGNHLSFLFHIAACGHGDIRPFPVDIFRAFGDFRVSRTILGNDHPVKQPKLLIPSTKLPILMFAVGYFWL